MKVGKDGYIKVHGLKFSPGNRTLMYRMHYCEANNVLGYIPAGESIIACFETKRQAERTYAYLRMNAHYSKYIGEIKVWGSNLNRKDKFWYETEE